MLDALGLLLGRLHPLLVHFPIALLIVAAAVEFPRLFARRREPSSAARLCLAVGAITALAAAGAGWLNADFDHAESTGSTLFIHRWLGITAAAIALIALLLGRAAARPRPFLVPYRLVLIISALLVTVVGHFGGMLTYGPDYIPSALRAVFNGAASAPAPDLASTAEAAPTSPAPAPDPALITAAIAVLNTSCVECHGAPGGRVRGQLKLATRAQAIAGGKSGPAITPGNPAASLLYHRITTDDPDLRMPPDGEEPLTDEQIRTLREWIAAGAPWPADQPAQPGRP